MSNFLNPLYGTTNSAYVEHYRLDVFHRPVFNEWYITAVKKLFGLGIALRILALLMLMATIWLFLMLLKRLSLFPLSAAVRTTWLVFSLSLFFGLYDATLSFSIMLVLLAVLSLLAIHGYINRKGRLMGAAWLALSCLSAFLLVFTKESAVFWLLVLWVAALFFESLKSNLPEKDDNKVDGILSQSIHFIRNNFILTGFLSLLPIAYFATRYIKLGSFTAIAAGIEQPVALMDSLSRFFGYVLFAMQIPVSFMPPG